MATLEELRNQLDEIDNRMAISDEKGCLPAGR